MSSKATNYAHLNAKQHLAKRVGGLGGPDYTCGTKIGEVKNPKSAVTSLELLRIAKSGVHEIDSRSGFAKPAITPARKHRFELFSRRKKI
jgi:hypothetical protein